jgi:predicted GTPase
MILLVGNKLDLVEKDPKLRKVSTELAQTLADTYNASFAEMSVFSEKGVNGILDAFAKRNCSSLQGD